MEFKKRNTKIFLVCGKARHGKDTISEMSRNYYKDKDITNLSYGYYIKDYAKRISNWDGSEETKPRELLQQLGTNLIRKQIDEFLFINRMIEDINVFSYFYDIITISDGRLKPEIDILKGSIDNVVVIRVNRPNFDNGLTEEQKNHLTEIDLDDYNKYDYVIENDGTLEDLNKKVIEILEGENNEY